MAANAGFEKIIKRQNKGVENTYRTSKRDRTVQRATERKGKTMAKYNVEA